MMESEVRDEVCDFDNLYRAMQHCKNNVMWKDSVAGYVKNGLVNVHKLKESVENGTYKLDAYTQFKVYEPKERDIVSTRIKDRVFQRSLCDNYFYDTVTKSFIYDNCACQDGRGTEFARKRLICYLQKYYRKHGTEGWVLKADLKNFFGSTSHELAYSAVAKRVKDEWVNEEIKRIIDSFNQGDDPEVGMGLGSETTQLIQLAVLDDFDHFVKEQLHIKHYVRYNDDFIIIHEDNEQNDNIFQGMRFLCAEDNELNAEILTELLKIEGAECTICENGEEILKTFEKSAPGDYDMILMDVQMPVMNGYEATKAIRRSSHELAKKIPIIAMTANAFSEDIQHSLAAGMNAHVSKPVEMRVLEKTIRSIKTGGGRNSRH